MYRARPYTDRIVVLQDPSVASSSIESRMSFLRTKNLTQEEIDAALSRVGVQAAPGPMPVAQQQQQQQQPQQYYQPSYPPQYQAWQPPPPPPKRDWRDWFIMATVVGGFSYGAYTLAKRYVVPLIAPPTPEKLEQDKKSIEEQFDKAFGLVEQLAKDTEELKATEQKRTEKLDTALEDIEKIMTELRNANQRRELETQRVKDDVQILKDSIPKAMNTQKDLTDSRLKEVNTELTSLKTLITQRMTAASSSTPANGLRTGATATPASPVLNRTGTTGNDTSASSTEAAAGTDASKPASTPTFNRPSPFSGATGAKASIPAWQMAMANKDSAASPAATNGTASDSSSQQQASASS
ncbi:peroxisomal membrane anchor protein conserved region-domain-containing protein [Colletotrichum godetiae]|uniref:Peroxisomal membrane protein PEX14 n=1 Tax=Colletotrichum godetiae TaxID=1209918 RepID=A0AAJ0ERL6_9PEZI|nr:peroxisomal membrane anchor protein conserved region-domain-containing protein [Colletotrichum godetiae]KAK1672922.1 peroxisomal membrane anchor protein conserved region-domain-containing protein [Colletotrichum godetiae]